MEMKDSQLPSKHDSVRVLRKYTTLTNEEIFRRVGMSYSSGYRALRGGRDEEPVEKPKEKRGRKRKLNEDAVKGVIQSIESQPQGEKSQSWDELAKQTGLEGISGITIKRAVEEAGYYKCSHCQRISKMHGCGKTDKEKETSKEPNKDSTKEFNKESNNDPNKDAPINAMNNTHIDPNIDPSIIQNIDPSLQSVGLSMSQSV